MWAGSSLVVVVVVLLTLCTKQGLGDLDTHKYSTGEPVVLWTNKVGPFPNPQETYPYYSLPFCRPEKLEHYHSEGLGETILGYDLVRSVMDVHFRQNVSPKALCEVELTSSNLERFLYAVRHQFWYQLFLDDLPVWGMVGEVGLQDTSSSSFADVSSSVFIFTHSRLDIGYNGDRVVLVNLTSENPKLLSSSTSPKLVFSYEVVWHAVDVTFERRFERYLRDDFLEGNIHWFSLVNSVMMVLFLAAMVVAILIRVLKRDLQFYRDVETQSVEEDDSGWKQVHGDVFRPPVGLALLASSLGTGLQLTMLAASVIALAFLGELHEERGVLITFAVVLYALTSFTSGAISGSFYQHVGGRRWIRASLFTAALFPAIVAVIGLALDVVAMVYRSQSSIPLSSLIKLAVIWALVALPLAIVGSMVGRHAGPFRSPPPCKVNLIPRPISGARWWMNRWFHASLSGLLPFGCMFVEMYYLFSSFWHYQYYYVFGFLALIFINVILVCSTMTVLLVYVHLNREDHRWWWLSFIAPSSTGLYVFLYSCYYYQSVTMMHGFFQTAFFFGYMILASIAVALMCGSVGFLSAFYFVRLIFRNVKID